MVAGRGIVRNYGRNNNSPATGQIKGRLLLSEGEKATLAEIAQRLTISTYITYIKNAGISSSKRPPGPELSSACADDHKTCIFVQFGSCHENVTQIGENSGKCEANGNK
jgi:hypothetical protein